MLNIRSEVGDEAASRCGSSPAQAMRLAVSPAPSPLIKDFFLKF
jgi:hypothetical protein